MVYYIRAKSYYRYALDLFKDFSKIKGNPSELQKKAKEIFNLGLKAVWALSYVFPPEKPPEFEELWRKTVESLDPADVGKLEKIKNVIFFEKPEEEKIIENIRLFLEIIKKVLQPIL
jgi:hypothetical protein